MYLGVCIMNKHLAMAARAYERASAEQYSYLLQAATYLYTKLDYAYKLHHAWLNRHQRCLMQPGDMAPSRACILGG